jgi:uncharacterized protein involved in response to NO
VSKRARPGLPLLSAGFRLFFLLSAIWACIGIPLWLVQYSGAAQLQTVLPPSAWHAHEMVFGFAAATVAGFMLTAIPNWTGRMPVQGGPLALLGLAWFVGRLGMLLSTDIGAWTACVLDLLFPVAFLAVVAREIIVGRNWRNLPMLAALGFLLLGNLLVHLEALGLAETAAFGNQLGIATLLMLISLVGGRIIPSFTRNWLAKNRPDIRAPAPFTWFDRIVMALTAVALVAWLLLPGAIVTSAVCLAAGLAQWARLVRWRGLATLREPLLWVLHLGYGWLGLGFCLLGWNGLPPFVALHALTVGAIGTMTLAVMTRATLGHTGRPLTAGPGTTAIYGLVTVAALCRLVAPFVGEHYLMMLWLAGCAWSAAFGLFAILYLRPFVLPRVSPGVEVRPI